jgi:hypothetical protein
MVILSPSHSPYIPALPSLDIERMFGGLMDVAKKVFPRVTASSDPVRTISTVPWPSTIKGAPIPFVIPVIGLSE